MHFQKGMCAWETHITDDANKSDPIVLISFGKIRWIYNLVEGCGFYQDEP